MDRPLLKKVWVDRSYRSLLVALAAEHSQCQRVLWRDRIIELTDAVVAVARNRRCTGVVVRGVAGAVDRGTVENRSRIESRKRSRGYACRTEPELLEQSCRVSLERCCGLRRGGR